MQNHFHERLWVFVFLVVLVPRFLLGAQSSESSQRIVRLKNQIEASIGRVEGEFGVAAKHIETGEEISINGDTYFPMASVFKIPVFVEVMAQIKEGRFTLEDEVSIQKTDQHLGSGYLSDLDAPGIKLSVRNLINLMMMISDNSATDILLTKVGAENVNNRLRSYGLENITVDRTCQHLIMDAIGMDYEKYKGLPLDDVIKAYRRGRQENPESFEQAAAKFSQVIKDQSSPNAMNRLLELIFNKEILDEESCDFIISVMLKCQTGERRLKGDLPRNVKIAHKTGTIGGTVNNVGIIYLPDDLGHMAITVFTKDTEEETQDIEDIIAQISRFIYDYFYFTTDLGIDQ
ncbi:MAG: serine hydrolase [Candidatus Aminicenantes bacterium]|nr:MAG: serine hydrolase [Candidatus Aminicenantes bacterium]